MQSTRGGTNAAHLGERNLFPTLEPRFYLNHGGISPLSTRVRAAVELLLEDYASKGAGAYLRWYEQRKELREALALLLHCRPEDLALVGSTSAGISAIALGYPWRAGDRVVVFQGEFPANVTPWQQASLAHGLELVCLSLDDFADAAGACDAGLEALRRELVRGVRLVAVSAVQFQTGLRMPLEAMTKLCHAYGAEIFVDGVQACGAVPLELRALELDYLAAGAHKWLMGMEGAGLLYIHPRRMEALRPVQAGWLSHETPTDFLFRGAGLLRYDRPIRKRADFLEAGNVSAMSFAALGAATGILLSLGVENIFQHIQAYLGGLEGALLDMGFVSLRKTLPEARSCTLSVRPPEGVDLLLLHRALGAHGIACATPDGLLRFTPHWPNSVEELPELCAAIQQCVSLVREQRSECV